MYISSTSLTVCNYHVRIYTVSTNNYLTRLQVVAHFSIIVIDWSIKVAISCTQTTDLAASERKASIFFAVIMVTPNSG